MKLARIICFTILNLGFIAMAVFLSVWTNCYHYLWLLTIPILSVLNMVDGTEESQEMKEWKEFKKQNGITIELKDKEENDKDIMSMG